MNANLRRVGRRAPTRSVGRRAPPFLGRILVVGLAALDPPYMLRPARRKRTHSLSFIVAAVLASGIARAAEQPDLQRRLQQELGAAAKREDLKEPPLLPIARNMREVQERMSRSDAGRETRHLQAQIVSDLDRMMEDARKSAGRAPPGAESKTPGTRTPTGTPNQPPQPKGPSKGGTGEPSPAGLNNPDAKQKPPDLQAEIKAAVEKLWRPGSGIELPQRPPDQMLDLPGEEVLPQYEILTEEYFRRLAEPKTRPEYER